jgi:hypothetical protein
MEGHGQKEKKRDEMVQRIESLMIVFVFQCHCQRIDCVFV